MVISRARRFCLSTGLLLALTAGLTQGEDQAELIPRKALFGNPERTSVQISPDGTMLGWLAPVDNVLNIWIAPVSDPSAARPITSEKQRGLRSWFWAYTNEHILYQQDKDGDEDFHLYAVELKSGGIRDLTPFEQIRARVLNVSEKFPDELMVGINDRDQHHLHDAWRINIRTGERKLETLNPGFAMMIVDDDYNVRLGVAFQPDASMLWLQPDESAPRGWSPFAKIAASDAMSTRPQGFDKTGKKMYVMDSRERNTSCLKLIDLETKAEKIIAEDERADISGALVHPTEKTVQAVFSTYTRRETQILDESLRKDFEYLKSVEDGEIQPASRSLDNSTWVVAFTLDDGPVKYYVYDRKAGKATYLFSDKPALDNLPLVKMHPEVIPSRDGLNLVSYLSLPKGSNSDGSARPAKPLPMVLLVHGGPWSRDSWGFNPLAQLLANRGYAVLAVNYRGSTGFGKNFTNAGNKEWAAKMHDDLIDAVNWAVDNKIAMRDRVAIMGGSYGGYATLVGLTFTPDVFACGVDIVGPSNLVSLLQNPPPYWMPIMPQMKERVGDFTTEAGRAFLKSRSPLTHADKIRKPLIIGQGAQDPRVKQQESDQIVNAMTKRSIPVTYLLFPKEGHGFRRPENSLAFFAVTEQFLSTNIGGRAEPIGKDFEGAEFDVPTGADQVPGLQEAVETMNSRNKTGA